MSFWSRARQLKPKFNLIQNQFNRYYSLNLNPITISDNHISPSLRSLIPVPNHNRQLELFNQVRFFASKNKSFNKNKKAGSQTEKQASLERKKEEKEEKEPKLNEDIETPFLRLVTDEGHAVISRHEALSRAKSLNLDLVEVDREAKPPVCKIFDYKKEKYIQITKDKERAKNKSGFKDGHKEVKIAAKITQNDLEMKADLVKRQIESGYRVKCTAVFEKPKGGQDKDAKGKKKDVKGKDKDEKRDDKAAKGTDQAVGVTDKAGNNKQTLEKLMLRFLDLIKEDAVMESELNVEKTQVFVYVRHSKFGVPKKGGKKASKAVPGSESTECEEPELIEPRILSDEDIQPKKPEWAAFDGYDDTERVFDIDDEVNELPGGSRASATADRSPRHEVEPAQPVVTNRYAKDPRAGIPSRDMNGRDTRNTMNNSPRIPNQIRPPQQDSMNIIPQIPNQMRPPQYDFMNNSPRIPNQLRPPQQDSSNPSIRTSPPKSYGMFTGQKVDPTPSEQSGAVETNRYKKNNQSANSSSTGGAPPQRNPPNFNRDVQRR